MEPILPTSQNRQILSALNILLVLLVLVCIMLLFLLGTNRGTIHFSNVPPGAVIQINGHTVASDTISLLPGTYQVAITSATTNPSYGSVQISKFHTTLYHPTLTQRNPDAIASSLLGSLVSSSVSPHVLEVRWFASNIWLTGFVTGDNSPIALTYDTAHSSWTIMYYKEPGYPTDMTKLPSDVASYIQQLGAQNV